LTIGEERVLFQETSGRETKCPDRRIKPKSCSKENNCQNQSKCLQGWLENKCDCRGTGYTGKHCEIAKKLIQLDGSSWVKLDLESEQRSFEDRIEIEFRTLVLNGVLFEAVSEDSVGPRLEVKDGSLLLEWRQSNTVGSNL
ncbi:hypothetical protein Ciccas_013384, partial [Cichlidogyrus casuarinus]